MKRKPVVGNVEDGWIYNQGKCRCCKSCCHITNGPCAVALMGDIPPGTDLETFEFKSRRLCVWCKA